MMTTTRIDWPYFNGNGTPESEAVELVERFTVSEVHARLNCRLTITDQPKVSEPTVLERSWVPLGAAIRPYACRVY